MLWPIERAVGLGPTPGPWASGAGCSARALALAAGRCLLASGQPRPAARGPLLEHSNCRPTPTVNLPKEAIPAAHSTSPLRELPVSGVRFERARVSGMGPMSRCERPGARVRVDGMGAVSYNPGAFFFRSTTSAT